MCPVRLRLSRLEMPRDVFDVPFPRRVKRSAEAARPVLPLPQIFHNLFRVRAGLAAVGRLVVLVERVGAPETPVAPRFRARILLPPLVELLLVALPIVLPLEPGFAGRAPVEIEPTSGPASLGGVLRVRSC